MKVCCTFWLVLLILTHSIFPAKILKEKKEFGEDILLKPGMIIAENNEVFVLDYGDSTVKIFSPEGKLSQKISGKGQAPSECMWANDFFMDKEFLYVHDTGAWMIKVFNKRTRDYLRSVKYTLNFPWYSPTSFAASDNGSFFLCQSLLLKGNKLITQLDKDFKAGRSFLDCITVYNTEQDYFRDKGNYTAKIFINQGLLASGKHSLFFVYKMLNRVLEFSFEGQLLIEYTLPLDSIAVKVKLLKYGDYGHRVERYLNYDAKFRNGNLYILSLDDPQSTVIYMLNNKVFIEIVRLNPSIIGFDIDNQNLYALDEEEGTIMVYDLPFKK